MDRPLLLLAHGAGAPSSSPWMTRYRRRLEALGEVVSFDYPYMRQGRKTPDKLPKLIEAHRQVLAEARRGRPHPVVLVGKSMGGRVGCHLALEEPVAAVVCLGYPLRGAGKTAPVRDEVLKQLTKPVLFVQGTRDSLCPLDLLERVRRTMKAPNELYAVEGGNHSLEVTKTQLKRSGDTQENVEERVVAHIADFLSRTLDPNGPRASGR